MKNFFKKLAFVMALAMVITSLAPAAGVFAASAPKLNAKSATLLLGTKGRTTFDFNLNNKVKGSTYKWTTSNKKVATVNAKNGLVTAVSNGKATIKLAITLPTKKVTNLSATVTVKTNATSVEITNLPTAAIKVGEKHNFNRTYTTNTKVVKTTDVTGWVITSENAAKASIDKNGFFTATEAGEYTIVAKMAQSATKYAAGTFTAVSKEVKVVVEPSIVSIAQTTSNKFVVTFDADMSKLVNKENLTITDASGVKQAIVDTVTFDATGKIATVKTYISLTDKEVYTVSYDKLSKDFVASIGAIAKVVITGPSLVADNEPTAIEVAYYDANGVDVTSTANGTLSFDNVSKIGWIDEIDNTITLFNIGDKTVIKAKYATGTYDANWNEVVIESAEYVVTAVDTVDATVSGLTAWTIANSIGSSSTDYTTTEHSIPLEVSTSKYLSVKTLDSKNVAVYDGYTFATTDASKLIVDPVTGQLIPVATGTVGVILTKGTFKTVITVTVTPKAIASTQAVDKQSANISEVIEQSSKYTVSLKDQYGNKFDVTAGKNELLSQPSKTAVAPMVTVDTVTGGKYEFAVKAVSGTTAGTYTYRLTVDNSKAVVVSATVLTSTSTTVTSYRFATESSSYDTVVSKDSAVNGEQTIALSVIGYDNKGVAIKELAAADVKFTAVNTADSNKTIEFVNGEAKVDNATVTGTYVVKGTHTTFTVVNTSFVVKNSQVKATVSKSSSELNAVAGADLTATLSTLFTAKSNAEGTITKVEVNEVSTTAKDVLATGTYDVYVKTVKVTETLGGNSVTYDVTVNAVLKLFVK